jgi:hypothetical protein
MAALVARIEMEAVVESDGGCIWRESAVKLSVLCCRSWQEPDFSRREVFSLLIYFVKKFYKIYTFSGDF